MRAGEARRAPLAHHSQNGNGKARGGDTNRLSTAFVREDESKVTLPKEMFAVDGNGALVARIMMADLEAALAAQAG